DIPYMFQGVPQSFFRAVADKIGIVPGSAEYAAYMQLIKDTTNAASFVRRMKRKQGVEGYSIDAMRGYADYFKRYGNYI
ncbi:hypothetical protein, partial [Escherichia coli]|uniref:hypothetical protein n=1 Tax=Escherichia coli TaxID=562 RepID=UPI003D047E04